MLGVCVCVCVSVLEAPRAWLSTLTYSKKKAKCSTLPHDQVAPRLPVILPSGGKESDSASIKNMAMCVVADLRPHTVHVEHTALLEINPFIAINKQITHLL